ncbi:oligosaccharide flippase family protein [Variovorax paradoxus]|nr:oligosaccharide flippase family protein [Variovorax paradoxus]
MRLSHIGWNLAGLSLPLLVAAVTVPRLISTLGHERFGLLALAWGLIGYAGALDLGIGRAVTQMVSRLRGEGDLTSVPTVLATARRITLVAGLVGGIAIAVAALCGGANWVKAATIPPAEIGNAMLLLAIALPAQAMSATYRGLNEAFLNFKGISLVRVALGVINFGGPYLVAHFTSELPWMVATLVASRLLALIVFRRLAFSCLADWKAVKRHAVYSVSVARSLFSFGGWIAVSSVVSPVLVQADRFLIGAILSAAAVSAYVLPYEVVVQSLILVGAISSVIFPSLAKMMHEQPNAWPHYFRKWLLIVGGMMLLVCGMLAAILPFLLRKWIGSDLQPSSVTVGQILCLGVFANAIGSMFYALLHAKGRADLTAKLHIVELPLFLVALFLLLHRYGVEGAAWAWVGRMVFDALILFWCSKVSRA